MVLAMIMHAGEKQLQDGTYHDHVGRVKGNSRRVLTIIM
jgi:hypothetical protein